MHLLVALWLLFAAPFWRAKPPAQWTTDELSIFFRDSPWAQVAESAPGTPGVQVYLASARIVVEAERELSKRKRELQPAEQPPEDDEYRKFIRESQGRKIVLAIYMPDASALEDTAQLRRMEEESVLKVGRKKYKMEGHFPPTQRDPYMRLVYPRVVQPSDRRFSFELYLPSQSFPFQEVEFEVKELMRDGDLEI